MPKCIALIGAGIPIFHRDKAESRSTDKKSERPCASKKIQTFILYIYFFWKAVEAFHRLISSCSTFCNEKWHPFDQV
ncbi:hypothetical protein DRW42_06680 [Pedobacter miscanthi]|uniref:Uncharacterized protein n=1 Tax=Pedobacter miscanthi TaxID=2259170 RepID=A0A366LAF7_9SPHI|nr:hypothetical protein DRW42_06680 [Pedobacter miscanthi]